MSPKEDGTMEFEEWLEEELKDTAFDEGDTLETFANLGEEVLDEEVRAEEMTPIEKLRSKGGIKTLERD